MSVIAAYYYNEGKRIREIALDERVQQDKSRSGFCWIALHEPSADELHTLQTTYHLHPLAIDNAMHPLCPPKLEVYNDELYVVAQTAELVGDKISYGKTAIFTGHNHLITARHGNGGALGNLRGSSRLRRRCWERVSTTCCTRSCTVLWTSICPSLK
jgi:magnesium transporter